MRLLLWMVWIQGVTPVTIGEEVSLKLSVAFSPQTVLFSPQEGWNRQVPVEIADEFSESCFCLSLASALLYKNR